MKKNHYLYTGGFMLVETLLVSLTIAGILIYMYAQFSSITDTYQKLYKYNTTEDLYHTDVIRQFLMNYTKKTDTLYTTKLSNDKAVDLVTYSFVNGMDKTYFDSLVSEIGAKKIILTYDDFSPSNVKSKIQTIAGNEWTIVNNFLKQIKTSNEGKYRIIIVYGDNDDTTNDLSVSTLLFEPKEG